MTANRYDRWMLALQETQRALIDARYEIAFADDDLPHREALLAAIGEAMRVLEQDVASGVRALRRESS